MLALRCNPTLTTTNQLIAAKNTNTWSAGDRRNLYGGSRRITWSALRPQRQSTNSQPGTPSTAAGNGPSDSDDDRSNANSNASSHTSKLGSRRCGMNPLSVAQLLLR